MRPCVIKVSMSSDKVARSLFRFCYLMFMISLFSGCASTPDVLLTQPEVAEPVNVKVVKYALKLEGVPYKFGKDSPAEGFDCSGFVKHVYQKQGVSLPRTTKEIARVVPAVAKDERKPGDLLFFNTDGQPFSHVGIYVGHGSFIHAPSAQTGKVIVSKLGGPYWWQRFISVGRPDLLDHVFSGR